MYGVKYVIQGSDCAMALSTPMVVFINNFGDRDRTPRDGTPWRLNAVETERRGDRTPSDRTPSDRTPSETECQVRLNAKQTECQGDMNAKYTYIMLWNMFWYSICLYYVMEYVFVFNLLGLGIQSA